MPDVGVAITKAETSLVCSEDRSEAKMARE